MLAAGDAGNRGCPPAGFPQQPCPSGADAGCLSLPAGIPMGDNITCTSKAKRRPEEEPRHPGAEPEWGQGTFLARMQRNELLFLPGL